MHYYTRGILEWSSMLYEAEFCFSLGIWLVVVQLKVIKQYCTRNKCEIYISLWIEVLCGFISNKELEVTFQRGIIQQDQWHLVWNVTTVRYSEVNHCYNLYYLLFLYKILFETVWWWLFYSLLMSRNTT